MKARGELAKEGNHGWESGSFQMLQEEKALMTSCLIEMAEAAGFEPTRWRGGAM